VNRITLIIGSGRQKSIPKLQIESEKQKYAP
jgi:hypothetical protein